MEFFMHIVPVWMCTGDGGGVRSIVDDKVTGKSARSRRSTTGLLALSDWLATEGCTHVVMEATGVYWKPVWHILEYGKFELILANAEHIKNVPGRKTDVKDATWIADLLAHGLIRGSFVFPMFSRDFTGEGVRPRTAAIRVQRPGGCSQFTFDNDRGSFTKMLGIAIWEAGPILDQRERPGSKPSASRFRENRSSKRLFAKQISMSSLWLSQRDNRPRSEQAVAICCWRG